MVQAKLHAEIEATLSGFMVVVYRKDTVVSERYFAAFPFNKTAIDAAYADAAYYADTVNSGR